MIDKVILLRNQIQEMHKKSQELFKSAEEIRKFYKYQCQELDSVSESMILSLNDTVGNLYDSYDTLDALVEVHKDYFEMED
jgi:uncharacterized coiled-coil DUF342 family protein